MKAFGTPLLSLLLAGVGVAMAFAWYNHTEWLMYVVGSLAVAYYVVLTVCAWRRLPKDPVGSVELFERRLVAIAGVTAVVSAIIIIIGIQLVVPDPPADAPDAGYQKAMKTVAAAGLSALIAFITAFGTKAEEYDGSVGETVSGAFSKKYVRVDKGDTAQPKDGKITLPVESAGWKAVFSAYDFEGWGKAARTKRAIQLEAYLVSKGLASARAVAHNQKLKDEERLLTLIG